MKENAPEGLPQFIAQPPQETPPFLVRREIETSREWCGFDAAADKTLAETAQRITDDPTLLRLAWHLYRHIFIAWELEDFDERPLVVEALGKKSGVFHLLIALGLIPLMRKYHQSLGVPEKITRASCQRLRECTSYYQRAYGEPLGLHRRLLTWQRNYLEPHLLFRLGRMEYWYRPFRGGIQVYRNIDSGEVLELVEEGVRFYDDGTAAPTTKEGPLPGDWTSTLSDDGARAVGHPVSPFGPTLRGKVCLSLSQWQCVLKKGTPILEMHIPEGGDMTLERCGESMHKAAEFFPRYFPDRPQARAIVCRSWTLNPQLEEFLPAESNLVRYLRELYLYPLAAVPAGGFWFVFVQDDLDPATASRETSLQRAILEFLKAGNQWRGAGGMFMLLDDLKHFGGQHYRNAWPVSAVS